MPSKDTYGSQPPLELLRSWLDHGYWSDLIDTTKIELIDMVSGKQLTAICQPFPDKKYKILLTNLSISLVLSASLFQSLVCAMGTLGGSNFIFPRLYRHMFVVAVDSFEDSTIIRIFTTIGEWHFAKGYPEKVALLSRVRTTTPQYTFSTHNNNNSNETWTISVQLSVRYAFWLAARRWRIIKLKWRIL